MSYDLYCYRSATGKPDASEAESIINADADSQATSEELENMKAVANALLAFDSRLEIFQFDHQKIAETRVISIDEAKKLTNYIEINTPDDDDNYIQFNIMRDHVSISFGFGMPPEFLERTMEYVDVICRKTGYFLYDPQDGSASDPIHLIPLSAEEKKSWVDNDQVSFLKQEKPWWKFW